MAHGVATEQLLFLVVLVRWLHYFLCILELEARTDKKEYKKSVFSQ